MRVLRNCCAAGSRAAQVVLHRNLHQSVVQFAAHLAARQSSSNKHEPALDEQQASLLQQEPLLLAAVQLLANICVAAEQQSLVVWQAMYARPVQQILCVKQGTVLCWTCTSAPDHYCSLWASQAFINGGAHQFHCT